MNLDLELIEYCISGDLNACINILSMYPNFDINRYYTEYKIAVREAFHNNHLQIVKYLFAHNPELFANIINENIFVYACRNDHKDMVEWLIQVKPTIDDDTMDKDQVFADLCINGYLELAQQFLEMHPDIDIIDYAILYYCVENEHLQILQWILEIKPEINISVDNAIFNIVYNCKNDEIAKWLITQNPDININHGDESYEYFIKIKKDIKWEKQKYALLLASDLSPNKNNILYRIPQDLIRVVCSFLS